MKIGVIGGGVVGAAIAKCYDGWNPAEAGPDCEATVWDVNPLRRYPAGQQSHHRACSADVVFVCLPEGRLDDFFKARDVSPSTVNYVIKSTCPIGTTRRLAQTYGLKNIVHSPEFLTERTADHDAAYPQINVIGLVDKDAPWLVNLYRNRFPGVPVRAMAAEESEAVKLFMNGFFAVKVAYWNEVAALADGLGIGYNVIREAIVAEGRVHPLHTLVPGPDGKKGFAGRCLPKDLEHLRREIESRGMRAYVTGAAAYRNRYVDRPRGGGE